MSQHCCECARAIFDVRRSWPTVHGLDPKCNKTHVCETKQGGRRPSCAGPTFENRPSSQSTDWCFRQRDASIRPPRSRASGLMFFSVLWRHRRDMYPGPVCKATSLCGGIADEGRVCRVFGDRCQACARTENSRTVPLPGQRREAPPHSMPSARFGHATMPSAWVCKPPRCASSAGMALSKRRGALAPATDSRYAVKPKRGATNPMACHTAPHSMQR